MPICLSLSLSLIYIYTTVARNLKVSQYFLHFFFSVKNILSGWNGAGWVEWGIPKARAFKFNEVVFCRHGLLIHLCSQKHCSFRHWHCKKTFLLNFCTFLSAWFLKLAMFLGCAASELEFLVLCLFRNLTYINLRFPDLWVQLNFTLFPFSHKGKKYWYNAYKPSILYLLNHSESAGPWVYRATHMRCMDMPAWSRAYFSQETWENRTQLILALAMVVCHHKVQKLARLTLLGLLHVPNA